MPKISKHLVSKSAIVGVLLTGTVLLLLSQSRENSQRSQSDREPLASQSSSSSTSPQPDTASAPVPQTGQEGVKALKLTLPDGSTKTIGLRLLVAKIHAAGQVESDFDYISAVAPSSDQTSVAFVLHGPAWNYIGVWSATTDTVQELAHGSSGYQNPLWSPDGGMVAFIAGGEVVGLQVADVATGDKVYDSAQDQTDLSSEVSEVAWSASSSVISFRSRSLTRPQEQSRRTAGIYRPVRKGVAR